MFVQVRRGIEPMRMRGHSPAWRVLLVAVTLVLSGPSPCDPELDEDESAVSPDEPDQAAALHEDDAAPAADAEAEAQADGAAPEPDSTQPALRRAWPPTTLSLALLATLEAEDGAQSRATIRDEDSGVIASYRPGDRIREAVEVLSIEGGVVELSNAGDVEYLGVSVSPLALSADDVFYPDLIDDLHRSGSMDDAVPLTPGPDYTVKAETYAWGTPRTIAQLRDVIHRYSRSRDVPRVHVGDISLRHGGEFPPHLSHRDGRDVDIAYVMSNPRARFGAANRVSLDRENTWALLKTFIDSGSVLYVFVDYEVQKLLYEHARQAGASEAELSRIFQYPHGRRAARGIIRHWKGHDDHFHVRFAP